jgi:hypothetical protein
MSDQAATIFEEVDLKLQPDSPFKEKVAGRGANRNIPNCYWRKGPDEADAGWIIVGHGLETRQADRWRERGREPLPQYSLTDRVSPKTGAREPIEYNEDQLSRHRYYWLFKNGGAKEFTVDQIVAHKWHVKPPYGMDVAVFPQLEEYVLPEPLWCAMCSPNTPPFNTPGQLLQHAMIGHKLDIVAARALLEDARTPPTAGGLNPIIRRKEEVTPEAEAERKAFAARAAAEAGEVSVNTSKIQICNACGNQIVGKLGDHHCEESRQPAGG